MIGSCEWVDLLDPTADELDAAWSRPLTDGQKRLLVAPASFDDLPRPRFTFEGDVILGTFILPVLDADRDRLFHREVNLVLMTDAVLSVRKTPRDGRGAKTADAPYDIDDLRHGLRHVADHVPGRVALAVVDDVAERYLDLIDGLLDLIDDLEDRVDETDPREIQRRISSFRHDVLHLRRNLAPTRDAVRRVVDGRIDFDDDVVFPHDLQLAFGDVYDKFLRAGDAMESARELLGGVRDYLQAKVSNDQNDVMKRLTVSASLLLLPTFIVGLYGQNFRGMPELHWQYGYLYSWMLIIVTTILQLAWFRRKRWI